MRAIRFFGWIGFLAVVFSACLQRSSPPSRSTVPLEELRSYLTTDDPQLATELLGRLLSYSVKELSYALKMPFSYPTVDVGALPSRTFKLDGRVWRYALYVPEDYDPGKAYPLILCLHGAGFDGDSYLDRWQPRLGKDYLLVCPTIQYGAWWTKEAEELVTGLLAEITDTYHVDRDRIFLTGMSNGGIGTYFIGMNHVDLFAAFIPMAAALPGPLMKLLDNTGDTPFYIIHGSQDQVIPPKYGREVEAYLRKNNRTVIYREHDRKHPMAGGHFFPREELPALIEWLSAQRRAPWSREVTIIRDRDHVGRAHWIRIDETDPEAGSFWASETDPEETRRLSQGLYARVTAVIGKDNQINISTEYVRRLTVLLNDELVDPARPIRIMTNGVLSFEGSVEPDPGIMLEEARRWLDPERLIFAAIELVVKP